ncbi:MAG: ribose 5-phosphate isomerase B [Lactococcus cremoris]|uniref:Ribose 5-phosphate isomerase n=4 Tax=Lactococcus lactis subsp. cremoris TaxID=1359 RepID=T0TMV6_LACLC|nr:ribose 5-phosphate isomerase B [Lactococcus cremoris]EQC57018.1 ribose 5-phosphate isomerase [Lactococcus cremoris subsp. cremoris TIFN6]EQC94543.1 ribose 5-phosphate isomerase [Lactococcus cremoris subsp. cremoris TIFN3]ABJ73135.1 ribose-5-phosphate isomerase [Lactococcus cremoris subsp. cremoris SK11]AEU40141.1 D-allose-6-phosphate isomerase [Lactococcus cremoris subsp. cremoris A76]AFW91980.1 ribose-5-phosphate isomerase B [Lactococcus cremoris subsp. cremoris UC509.9]
MKLAIGSDHVGFELKPLIIDYLEELGHEVTDFGPFSTERTDYPIYGKKVAEEVAAGHFDGGVLICGTGVGISISANKVRGIRAVVCSEPYSAKLSKEHNNTNIVAFGSRVVGSELAKMIVKEWLEAIYEGGRHAKRIEMITELETEQKR